MLSRASADVVLGQEHKRCTAARVDSARAEAKGLKWSACLSQAHPTAAAAGSGGCVVAVRASSGIHDNTTALVSEPYRHRVAVSWVDGIVPGGVHCISAYFRHSEGLSPANMALLDELTVVIRSLTGPWLLAADWNFSPAVLVASGWTKVVRGEVFATSLPTCHDSTYAYFVVHSQLAKYVVAVQRVDDTGLYPHFASRLLVHRRNIAWATNAKPTPRSASARRCGAKATAASTSTA